VWLFEHACDDLSLNAHVATRSLVQPAGSQVVQDCIFLIRKPVSCGKELCVCANTWFFRRKHERKLRPVDLNWVQCSDKHLLVPKHGETNTTFSMLYCAQGM
jgi:hypothetical protein